MIGSSLSHFRVTAKLGEGGMGEVYRAEDSKLGREVAIKVLPEAVAADPERLARFEREAKVLASLNHPNLAAIYSFEAAEQGAVDVHLAPQEEGEAALGEHPPHPVHFLVMELVEGENLQKRLVRGAISVDEALPMALQIAHALEAAHGQGIIHRDLKPANVMVDEEDQVKVLDFGLAKALDPLAGDSESGSGLLSPGSQSLSPTLTAQMTGVGVLLGTASYMSPEQARGKKADKRADIWAFGVVLWEMLTGQRLFEGETVSDTLAAVLRADLDWETLAADTPRPIVRLLHRCLERNPKERLHDIADARLEIEQAMNPADEAERWDAEPTSAADAGRGKTIGLALAAGLILGALLAWLGTTQLGKDAAEAPRETLRVASGIPDGVELRGGGVPAFAISPDGRKLVTVGEKDDEMRLYQRPLHQYEWLAIPGTEKGNMPFFSPDGEWVAFIAEGKLKKVSLAGGTPQVICDAPNSFGGAWGPDGTIVFNPSSPAGLMRVSELGGVPEILTVPDSDAGESEHDWPQFLPGGGAVVFTVWKGSSAVGSQVALWDLDKGEKRILIDGSFGRVTPSGHLLFALADSLYVVAFDLERLEVIGKPIPVPDPIYRFAEYWLPFFDFSQTGTMAYLPGRSEPQHQLVSVGLDGTEAPLIEARDAYMYPRLSPDGRRLAVNIMEGGTGDIWIIDLASGARTRLTREGGNLYPLWTADGEKIIYLSDRTGLEVIMWQPADGSGGAEELVASVPPLFAGFPTDVSRDGKYLLFERLEEEDGSFKASTISALSLADPSDEFELLRNEVEDAGQTGATFSPDGRWIAYVDADGRRDMNVYVQAFPDGGARHQVSRGFGIKPQWARDGRAVYYRNREEGFMAASLMTGPEFQFEAPIALFEDEYDFGTYLTMPNYEPLLDGSGIVMVEFDEEIGRSSEIRIVFDWLDELEKLVPGGGSR